jgi:hypothetical protein
MEVTTKKEDEKVKKTDLNIFNKNNNNTKVEAKLFIL